MSEPRGWHQWEREDSDRFSQGGTGGSSAGQKLVQMPDKILISWSFDNWQLWAGWRRHVVLVAAVAETEHVPSSRVCRCQLSPSVNTVSQHCQSLSVNGQYDDCAVLYFHQAREIRNNSNPTPHTEQHGDKRSRTVASSCADYVLGLLLNKAPITLVSACVTGAACRSPAPEVSWSACGGVGWRLAIRAVDRAGFARTSTSIPVYE